MQMKGKVHINDDVGLGKEADVMRTKALNMNNEDLVVQGAFFNQLSRAILSNQAIRQLVKEGKTPGISVDKKAVKTAEGHADNPVKDELLEHKGFRKLNRICGQINVIPHLETVAALLNAAIVNINLEANPANYAGIGDKYDPIKAASVTRLDAAIALDPLPPKIGDECLLLGTLDYWATNCSQSDEIKKRIEALRLKMQKRARMSIIAHRGMGATNKSFGGLIPDTDPARGRPTENSRAAFASALSHASTPTNPWGLDGIECDVFLSQDGVPIVSHDRNISEQMSEVKRAAYANADATIGATNSDVLMGLARKAADDLSLAPKELSEHTVFMSLRQLLDMTAPVATVYAAQHHKGFRFEIEMKGGDEGVHNIVDITAKTVSKFKKGDLALQAADMEIVMFNGDSGQVAAHLRKRMTKTKLGGLVVGLGAPHPTAAKVAGVDEYRMSLSDSKQIKAPGALTDNYLSTYVLGGEQHILTGVAPTLLEWGKGPELQSFVAANVGAAQSVNKLWAAFQRAHPVAAKAMDKRDFTYPMEVEKKRADTAGYRTAQGQLHVADGTRTHLLTDYPEHVHTTRGELGPEGDRIATAIQHLLMNHDWAANPTKGNKNKAAWTALLATVQSRDTFSDRGVRLNATPLEIITDLGAQIRA